MTKKTVGFTLRPRSRGVLTDMRFAFLYALLFAGGACGDNVPTGSESPTPAGEAARTTAVDSAVIGTGVFTAQLGESRVNQFGFTMHPLSLHVRNGGKDRLVGRFHWTPACPYWVRLYLTNSRNFEAAWDPSREESICVGSNTEFEIEAGVEEVVDLGDLHVGVLGDSLPEGWYYPTLTIAPFGVLTELKVDSAQLTRP